MGANWEFVGCQCGVMWEYVGGREGGESCRSALGVLWEYLGSTLKSSGAAGSTLGSTLNLRGIWGSTLGSTLKTALADGRGGGFFGEFVFSYVLVLFGVMSSFFVLF